MQIRSPLIVASLAAGTLACDALFELSTVEVSLSPASADVAVGANLSLVVFANQSDCLTSGGAAGPDLNCIPDPSSPQVTRIALDDQSAFEMVTEDPLVLRALGAGAVTVTVEAESASDQGSGSGTYQAWVADNLSVTPRCDEGGDASVLVAGSTVPVDIVLRSGTRELLHEDFLPIDTGGAATFGPLGNDLQVSNTPQTLTLASPIDPSFTQVHQITDPAGFDSLDMQITIPDCAASRILTEPRRAGDAPCLDRMMRTYTIETPGVCAFDVAGTLTDPVTRSGNDVPLFGLTAGICQVRADLVGGPSASAQVTFDGCQGWEELAPPGTYTKIRSMAALSPDNVYFAVGTGGLVHFDGAMLSDVSVGASATLFAVFATGTEVFAVGDAGTVVRFDGLGWQTLANPVGDPLYSVWGAAANDVYMGSGDLGALLHWDGNVVSAVTSPATSRVFRLWGSGPNDIYGMSTTEIVHFDGGGWTVLESLPPQPTMFHRDLHGSDAANVFVARDEEVHRYTSPGWELVETFPPATTLRVVWAHGSNELYAASTYSLFRLDNGGEVYLDAPIVGEINVLQKVGASLFLGGTGLAVRR